MQSINHLHKIQGIQSHCVTNADSHRPIRNGTLLQHPFQDIPTRSHSQLYRHTAPTVVHTLCQEQIDRKTHMHIGSLSLPHTHTHTHTHRHTHTHTHTHKQSHPHTQKGPKIAAISLVDYCSGGTDDSRAIDTDHTRGSARPGIGAAPPDTAHWAFKAGELLLGDRECTHTHTLSQ